jgi:hypothetical protein
VHDAGNPASMFRSDDEHIAAVALGDDLFLQILRGIFPAKIRFERATKPRALLAQAISYQLQLRAALSTTSPVASIFSRTCVTSR